MSAQVLWLVTPTESQAASVATGAMVGAIADAGAEWYPAVGINLDLDVGQSFNFRHFAWGIKRGVYNTYGSHTAGGYYFPLSADKKSIRFRLGAGYMRKVVSVPESEVSANGEFTQKYSTGYVYLSNGVSFTANLGSFFRR